MAIEVSEKFMEALVTRYSAVLQAKEVRRELRKHNSKYYTRKIRQLNKELKRIYNDILTADSPAEIRRLREEYIRLQKDIAEIKEARNRDPKVQGLRGELRRLSEAVNRLDEMIVAELRNYGYEVKPMDSSTVEAKIRELNPNTRDIPGESADGVAVAEAKP